MNKTIYPIIADTGALPLCLTGVGNAERMMPVNCRKGVTDHQFVITTGGEGILSASGQSRRLAKNSFAFIAADTPFSFEPEGSDWSAVWVTFGGSMAAEMLGKLGFGELCAVDNADTEECVGLAGQLMNAAEAPIPAPRMVSALLYAFILAAQRAMLQKDAESYPTSITASVDHINRHYSEDITLERLAQISGVSLQHFCRVFRSRLGMRPMEYLARKRVAQAKILLGETDSRISDIAAEVGFDDQNYFGITFKKYEGISPTEYRREHGMREKNG